MHGTDILTIYHSLQSQAPTSSTTPTTSPLPQGDRSYALDSQLMGVVTGATTTADTKSHEAQDTTSSSKVSEMMRHCVE